MRAGGGVSAALHAAILALLLFGSTGSPPTEEQTAPNFAVQFVDSGAPSPQAATAQPIPEVNLGGSDTVAPPPPEDRPAEALPVPPPSRRYGSGLHPRARSNPFAHVTPFDLTPQQPRSLASGGRGGSLDLSAGPVIRNGRLQDSVVHVMGSHGMSDYMDALNDFVESHKYYPRAAADNGEEGSAELLVTISRDGTVKSMRLVSSSGSPLLDAAWMSVFRDHRLPAFNDDMRMGELTIPVTLNYHLIYGR